MKRVLTVVIVLWAFIVLPVVVLAQTQFSRNLSIGSRGEDVRKLQQILNQDSRTRLGTYGPGSLGNETTYFGPLTRAAVVRFQELYASEILKPLGLTGGTGFFGSRTRTQMETTSDEVLVTTTRFAEIVSDEAEGLSLSDFEDEFLEATQVGTFDPEVKGISIASIKKILEIIKRMKGIFDQIRDLATGESLENFGGRVIAIPCTCSFGLVWNVFVGPPRPVLADYIIGTQFYASRNFPRPGIQSLGKYLPLDAVKGFGGGGDDDEDNDKDGDDEDKTSKEKAIEAALGAIEKELGKRAREELANILGGFDVTKIEQSEICYIGIPPDKCFPLFTQGYITPIVGSSGR